MRVSTRKAFPMPGTAIVYSPRFKHHETSEYHPEKIARMDWILEMLEERELDQRVRWLDPESAPRRAIEAVHWREYIGFVEDSCLSGASTLDGGETLVGEESYAVAMLAAGAAMRAVDAVLRDGFDNAFSLARPPGHHARPGGAMGFCIFCNVAVAARYALSHYNLPRVAILDWDVHHGNGTQEIFYREPRVLFGGWHESPLYPLTGDSDETGAGPGAGFTVNCPLPAGSGLPAFKAAWDATLLPALRSFQPSLIIVSAGFDAHVRDPLAHLCLEAKDYTELTRMVGAAAKELSAGRLVSVLEGGYDRLGLPLSVAAHLEGLLELSRS
jgi:acetoin utilization deacetylase AcuC-like enzyme